MIYKLIVMSFDGEFIIDSKGSFENCKHASSNMGSKWFFYPFHFIVNDRGTVKGAGVGLVNMSNKKPFSEALFNNRKIKTVQKIFKKTQAYCLKNEPGLDALDFERIMIERNSNLIRWHVANTI